MKALVGYKSGLGEPSDILEAIDRLKGQLITAEHATRLAAKGYAERYLEEQLPGVIALFFNGAEGDVAPTMGGHDGALMNGETLGANQRRYGE